MTDKKRTWYAVDILADATAGNALEFALNELESTGTEIDSLRKKNDEPQIVTGFFEALPANAKILAAIEESLRIHKLPADVIRGVETRVVEETDWLAEWKRHWKPTEIGRFIVAPPWENVDRPDRIVIYIEPNMAFGTGTHETTQLCLKAIGKLYQKGQTLLDVGTGTGILAIAAAKLGAEIVLACDTDEDSIKIARENAVANGADWIKFFDGTLDADAPIYDFVCANLTVDVIFPILPLLLLKTRVTLLMSGILAAQESIIIEEITRLAIQNFEIETAGEWISVTVKI